jgi:hypothetical protein
MLERALVIAWTVAAIARAAARVCFHERGGSISDVVSRLRSAPHEGACDPGLSLAVLDRLLPFLPPYRLGRCVKRSFYLLDLWSRAGLSPSFHLGIRESGDDRRGHAWITTRTREYETYRPPDVLEAFRA